MPGPIITESASQLIDTAMAYVQAWGWLVFITIPLVIAIAGWILSRFFRRNNEEF